MGGYWSNRIDPSYRHKNNSKSLLNINGNSSEICRKNFRFLRKMFDTGPQNQSLVWLAENWQNPQQKFFVKVTNKLIVYRNHRMNAVKNQLSILQNKGKNQFLIEPYFAFQDYCSLYLVTEYIQGFTLQEVLREHIFTQQQAKYVITALIGIIQCLHRQKFVVTQLNPKNILVQKKTGKLKLIELINPLEIDSYYPSHMNIALNQYSAPEILAMDQVLAQSDYYSLGLILYYIMKCKSAIPEEIKADRMAIFKERILVMESDLPESWKPQAVDFLVKLLIKNPELRLGRYGSFQIRNHPWLQNYTWSSENNFSGVNLKQPYFNEINYSFKQQLNQATQVKGSENIDHSFEFQRQFNGYQHSLKIVEQQTVSYDSIQEQF